MGFLNNQDLITILGSGSVRIAVLLEMEFSTGTTRIWTGAGELRAGEYDWIGTGAFVSVSGLEQLIGTAALRTDIVLSGIDVEITQLARANDFELSRGSATIYAQIFDEHDQPLGDYFHIASGNMGKLNYKSTGPSERQITMPLEGIFYRRNRPRFGLYTQADQDRRLAPTIDLGLEFVESLVEKTVTWPDY